MTKIILSAFADEANEKLSEQIKALQEDNISCIELRGVDGKNVSSLEFSEAEEYAKTLREGGIKVWALGSPIGKIGINGDHEEHLKKAEHTIKLCSVFGTKNIRAFSFFTSTPNESESKVFKRVEEILNLTNKYGVNFCHENEKDIYGDRVERVLKLKEKFPELKLVFDPANYIQCGENIPFALESLRDKTFYYHIKDALYSGEIVPAGEGEGRISDIVDGVDDEVVFTLEPHLKVFSGYGQIDGTELKNRYTHATNRDAFKASGDALKKILRDKGFKEGAGEWIK